EHGEMVPVLAEAIPTVENGGITPDRTSIVWKLKPGTSWSDGTPLTAEDVVFTAAYCMDPEGGCAQALFFDDITSIEALDTLTVRITFDRPKPIPQVTFAGAKMPILQKAQFQNCTGARAASCTHANFRPIG